MQGLLDRETDVTNGDRFCRPRPRSREWGADDGGEDAIEDEDCRLIMEESSPGTACREMLRSMLPISVSTGARDNERRARDVDRLAAVLMDGLVGPSSCSQSGTSALRGREWD